MAFQWEHYQWHYTTHGNLSTSFYSFGEASEVQQADWDTLCTSINEGLSNKKPIKRIKLRIFLRLKDSPHYTAGSIPNTRIENSFRQWRQVDILQHNSTAGRDSCLSRCLEWNLFPLNREYIIFKSTTHLCGVRKSVPRMHSSLISATTICERIWEKG